jgi:hypothetical protein
MNWKFIPKTPQNGDHSYRPVEVWAGGVLEGFR